jgi:hypothetical protein
MDVLENKDALYALIVFVRNVIIILVLVLCVRKMVSYLLENAGVNKDIFGMVLWIFVLNVKRYALLVIVPINV